MHSINSIASTIDQGLISMRAKEQPGVVYMIDDDPAVLKLLQAMVATIGVASQVFANAGDFLATYRPQCFECLVCDVRMPEIDGIELQKRLNAKEIAPPLIFLTGFAEVGVAVAAMKHGAFDFLEKPFSAQALLGKVQAAIVHSHVQHTNWQARQAREARLALLTQRERGVIRQVLDSKSSRQIAEEMSISVRTVENHRTRILEKLHVESTVDLVKLLL